MSYGGDPSTPSPDSGDDSVSCGSIDRTEHSYFGLRVGAIFIILVTSLFGTLLPIVAKRSLKVPMPAFDFVKYFGSGVIIATAFIHLLSPAFDELTAPCLTGAWQNYPFAAAFSMASVFMLFFTELFAFRAGSTIVAKAGVKYDMHMGGRTHTHTHEAGGGEIVQVKSQAQSDEEAAVLAEKEDSDPRQVLTQIVGIAILEFGVVLHSVIIGLTLAVDPGFTTLFIVLIFHQMFEGLGLGSRLAFLQFPPKYRCIPYVGACLYSICTPIGIAIGLGVRTSYNPDSTTANIVSGVLDAFSSGVLLYTGLVELLAHEFIFNPKMHEAPLWKIVYAGACMLLGAGLMSLLGYWA